MQTIEIGGEAVPRLGFGTWTLRGGACRRVVVAALEHGYRHLDTAAMYQNEEAVGNAIADSAIARGDLFITTKVWSTELAPARLRASVDHSLRQLRLTHVDLLLIHWPNPDVPLADSLGTMVELQQEGKLRHLGVSNFAAGLFRQACELAPIFCNQVEYHPFLAQDEVLAIARQRGVMITAYCPLARGHVFADATLQRLAKKHGRTPAQISLRWLLQQEQVSAIPKAGSIEHLAENLQLFDFELSADEMATISGLARNERLVQI